MFILSSTLLFILITFIISNHPLIIGFLLIISRILYGLIFYILNSIPWLVYILVIIFVRGAIVIFIYIASLSSNEPINIIIKPTIKNILLAIIILSILFIFIKQLKINYINLNSINQFLRINSIEVIYKTYNFILIEITISLTIYLLLVLIVRVKIVKNFKLPLRTK